MKCTKFFAYFIKLLIMLLTNILFRRDLSRRHATYSSLLLPVHHCDNDLEPEALRTRYATAATATGNAKSAATTTAMAKFTATYLGPLFRQAGSDEISYSITCHAFPGSRGFLTPLHMQWCTYFNNLLSMLGSVTLAYAKSFYEKFGDGPK